MQIHMQCDNGEIEVFLCPEEESASGSPSNAGSGASSSEEMTDTESEASPMKPLHQMAHPPSPPPRLDLDEESRSSDIGQIRNVLISASDDFGCVGQKLQLQTLDQENGEYQILNCDVVDEEYVGIKKSMIRRLVSLPPGSVAVIHVHRLVRLCITVAVPCGRLDPPS